MNPAWNPASSADETVRQVFDAIEEAETEGKKAVVCTCGVYAVDKDAARCPECGQEITNRHEL